MAKFMTGPRSGRHRIPTEAKRLRQVMVRLREREFEDLAMVADAWGCGVAEAAWAIVADVIGRARSERVDMSGTNLPVKLAEFLTHERAMPRGETVRGSRDAVSAQ